MKCTKSTLQILTLLIISNIFIACAPKITTSLVNQSTATKAINFDDISVFENGEASPAKAVFIGNLKVGDSGFTTDCGYEKVMYDAKRTAQKSGANLIVIEEKKQPNLASSCYRIKGKMYYVSDENTVATLRKEREAKNKSRLPADADYAMVHIYRPRNPVGSLIGYKVRMDENIIGAMPNGTKISYKVTDFGTHEFWAKTEARSTLVLKVEKGEEYFIHCSIKMGVMVGQPVLQIVKNATGISQMNDIKSIP